MPVCIQKKVEQTPWASVMASAGLWPAMEDPLKEISRKELLKKGAVVGAVSAVSVALAYCKKKPAGDSAPAAAGGCGDVSGLTQAEKDQRTSLNYTDKSSKADMCSGCALFVAPAGGAACGGCNLLKGPIAPEGWCSSFVKKG